MLQARIPGGGGGSEHAYKDTRDQFISNEVPLVALLDATLKQFKADLSEVEDVKKVAEAAINVIEEAAFSQAALNGHCRLFSLEHLSSLIARLLVRNT